MAKTFTTEAENKIFVASLILMVLTFFYNLIALGLFGDVGDLSSFISFSMVLSLFAVFVLGVVCLNIALIITKKYKFGFNLFTFLGILFSLIVTTFNFYFIINYSVTNLISLGIMNILFMVLSIFIGGFVKK